MKKVICFCISVLLSAAAAFSQSADKMTEILDTKTVTYQQAAYFFAVANGMANDSASETAAVEMLKQAKLIKEDVHGNEPIPLNQVAFLCANTWNVKGGLMYRIFKNPRYSFKQLQADGIISYTDDPSKILNGHQFMNVIVDCINLYERGVK